MVALLAERLKEAREKKGFSQDAVAESLGIKSGKQTISRWERGLAEPSIAQLFTMAELFEVSVAWLIGESNELTSVEKAGNKMLIDKDEYINLLRQDNQRKKDEIDRLSGSAGNLTPTSSYVVQLY